MEEISDNEKRGLFDIICGLRNVGSELLRELFMRKFIGSEQSLDKYFHSNTISRQIRNCEDFTEYQQGILYPRDGASPRLEMGGIKLICKLIRKLPLKSSDESAQGDGKSNGNPYVCAVENIRKIFKETYDIGHIHLDKRTFEDKSKSLRDIYKSIAKDLPQEQQLKFSQLIDGKVQGINIKGGPDKHKGGEKKKEYGNVEETAVKFEIAVKNYRLGQIIKLDVPTMETYCKSDGPIKKGEFGFVYKWEKSNQEKYLIKKLILTDKEEDKDRKEKYYTELYHEIILHPYVVPIIAHAEDSPKDPRVVYLMYPYMENGSVSKNIIRENKGETFRPNKNDSNSSVWIRCIYQVASALDYLHNNGKHDLRGPVFHRNLTSRTILFDECFNAKLCDFGRAVEAKHNAVEAINIQPFSVPGYHPRMMDKTCYKASYDVYSFCVVILEILTGEVVKDDNPFSDLKGDLESECLLKKIQTRPWIREDIQDELAQKAWKIISVDETETPEVKAADVLQIIKGARIESDRLYKEEINTENCVSCYINRRAKDLPLKGKECNGCTMFCVYCLTDYHNELICPRHGPTRPPFGDHVYGVLVAGNHVPDLHDRLKMNENPPLSAKDIAKIFIRDAKKLANVLTSKFPLVLGARTEHFKVVTPKEPGTEGKMERLIKKAFKKINKLIRDDQKNYPHRKDSLFIFYFTGHGDQTEETEKCTQQNLNKYLLYLGGIKETTTADWLRDMLHETLLVDNVLVILDCCYASGHYFVHKNKESGFTIYQLSSCDEKHKSVCDKTKGSYFTHFLCQALRGAEKKEAHCRDCKKENGDHSPCKSFHFVCSGTQKVTLNDVETYIQGHYDLLKLQNDVKKHAKNAGIIELTYYKYPDKQIISIGLEGSESEEMYSFSEVPDSIPRLRKDIVKYIEERNIQCEILEMLKFLSDLNESLGDEKAKHKHLIKDTSHLVAIYQQYEQETEELTCLNDLWKIRPSLMSLNAKIRQDVSGLRNGPIKYDMIKKAMTMNYQESYFSKRLGISQDCLQLVCKIEERLGILKDIEDMESATTEEKFLENKWLLNNLYQLVVKCQIAGAYDEKETKILKFRLYKPFSIAQFE